MEGKGGEWEEGERKRERQTETERQETKRMVSLANLAV